MESYIPRGTRIGPYVVVDELGRGDLGITLLSTDAEGNRVALKLLLPDGAPLTSHDIEDVAEDLGEVAAIESPSIPPVLWVSRFGEHLAIASGYLPAGNLGKRLSEGALSMEATLAVVHQVAAIMADAHRAGVAHGGLKPTNIFRVSSDGRPTPVIVDFGAEVRRRRWAAFSENLGDDWFTSPEVSAGRRPTPASDVFSLGRLLQAMLAGRELPQTARDVIPLATMDLPEQRYPDAAAFLADLERGLRWERTEAADAFEHIAAARALEEQRSQVAAVSSGPAARRKSPMPWILAVGGVAAVIAFTSVASRGVNPVGPRLADGTGYLPGLSDGARPGTPGVKASAGYKAVDFKLTRAEGDETLVQVNQDGLWEDAPTGTLSVPTVTGGQQACVQLRSANKSESTPHYSPVVSQCGTSAPVTLAATRVTAGCGKTQICYVLSLEGFESNTNQKVVATLGSAAKGTFSIPIGADGKGTSTKSKVIFATGDKGKTAHAEVGSISIDWVVGS